MSVAAYLLKKCKKKMDENYKYVARLWNDPGSVVKFDMSGALVDAAKGGMGALGSLAEAYLVQNADALVMAAATGAAGKKLGIMKAFEQFQDMLAMILMLQNAFVFRLMKEVARTTMEEIEKKDAILIKLAERVRELYAALASLVGAENHWDSYLEQLREALREIYSVEKDLNLVYNTLDKNGYWLSMKFDKTVTKLEHAKSLITPKKNNPAVQKISDGSYKVNQGWGAKTHSLDSPDPEASQEENDRVRAGNKARRTGIAKAFDEMGKGLAIFGEGLSSTGFPFPTTDQQWQAMLAIGKTSNFMLLELKSYMGITNKVNGLVESFKFGMEALTDAVPGYIKNYILKLLKQSNNRVTTLRSTMAKTLNGNADAIDGPFSSDWRPSSLQLTVQGFKWVSDINLILQGYKAIPKKMLDRLSLREGPLSVYRGIVARLNDMYPGGASRSVVGKLRMVGGIESLGDLESQILAFALEANNAIISSSVRKEILPLGIAILGRLELGLRADAEIFDMMDEWYNYKMPEDPEMDKMMKDLKDLMGLLGMDRALEALRSGDFKSLLSMKGMMGTFVGSALSILALLEMCDLSYDMKVKLWSLKASLNADMDLLNFSFSIDFNLAIFKNLLECLQLKGLANMLSLKELLCGIVQDIANGDMNNISTMTQKMTDAFSTDESATL